MSDLQQDKENRSYGERYGRLVSAAVWALHELEGYEDEAGKIPPDPRRARLELRRALEDLSEIEPEDG